MTVQQPDPITIEIVRNAFISIATEMNANLARSAFSPVIYEMKDCSVGLFNEQGDLLGQSPGLPLFLGGLDEAVKVTVARVGRDHFQEGDVFAVNDPYLVGSHLNDVTVISPIFYQANLVGFTAVKAHWNDLGAKDPGFSANTTEVYQEGLRFAPIRVVAGGQMVVDVLDILCRNSRSPRYLLGDLNAQIVACRTGERRYLALLDQFGPATVAACIHQIFVQAEALDRAAVETIPDGVYHAEGAFDNDGVTDEPVWVRVTLIVQGSQITIDLSGSSPQRQGCTNCGLAQTISAARLAFKYLFNHHQAPCGGNFRNLSLQVPEGSIFAAREPAACQFYSAGLGLMIDLVFRALAEVMPQKVIAGQTDDSMNVLFVGRRPQDGSLYTTGEATAIGWGASAELDGGDAMIDCMGGDLKNLPVETLELKHPLRVLKYQLARDAGGPGQRRGGLGVIKNYQVLQPGTELTLWFERTHTPGWGLFGGIAGAPPGVILNSGTVREQRLTKVNHLRLEVGDVVSACTGGAGGYGPPWKREPQRVLGDVLDGYISRESAWRDYGVCLLGDPPTVDVEATAKRRNHLKHEIGPANSTGGKFDPTSP